MTLAGGLSLQTVGFNGKGMASLSVSSHSHSLPGIREKKLILREKITVRVPHSVVAVMKYKGQYWPTNARMDRYQSMLCKNPQVK
jgi:hypothetical protein